MLNKLPISIINYLCFGCDRCRNTEEELFVYIYNKSVFNIIFVFSKKVLYCFDIGRYQRAPNSHFYRSSWDNIEQMKKFYPNNVSSRITSLEEFMERIEECG